MRDRLKVTGFVLWLLATVILGTILVAWLIYPMEISWLRIQNRTGLTPAVIQKNFQILMQYLTSPFTWKLEMPDFPFSSSQVPLSPDPGLLPGFVASGYTIYSNGHVERIRRSLSPFIWWDGSLAYRHRRSDPIYWL